MSSTKNVKHSGRSKSRSKSSSNEANSSKANQDLEQGKIGLGGPECPNPFDDDVIRRGFVCKVLAIVSLQLVFTFAVCLFVMLYKPLKTYLIQHPESSLVNFIYFISIFCYIITATMITCCPCVRKTVPWNYLTLGALTLSVSLILGISCANENYKVIAFAVLITLISTVLITIISRYTSFDFTKILDHLCLFLWLLLFFSITFSIITTIVFYLYPGLYTPIMLVSSFFCVIIYLLYLAFEMQMLMGGGRYELSPEEYIFAAMIIYLNIIDLFYYIYQVLKLGS